MRELNPRRLLAGLVFETNVTNQHLPTIQNVDIILSNYILTCVPLYEGIEPSSLVAVNIEKLAEVEGFEPSGHLTATSCFPSKCNSPLYHTSENGLLRTCQGLAQLQSHCFCLWPPIVVFGET